MRRAVTVALFIAPLLLAPALARAQAPGDRTEVVHPLLFQMMNDNITLDPTANVAPASRIEFTRSIDNGLVQNPDLGLDILVGLLHDVGIDIPGWLVDFIDGVGDFSNVDISAYIGPYLNADYGGYFQVKPSSKAGVKLAAPVNIVDNVPAMNSFKCGDEIAVRTAAQFPGTGTLTVQPTTYDFQLGPVFKNLEVGAKVGVNIDLCVGLDIPKIGCAGYSTSFNEGHTFSYGIPLPGFLDPMPPLINVCSAAFKPGANEADLLGCSLSAATPLFNIWQQQLDDINLVTGSHYTIAEFSPGKVTLEPPDLPLFINFTLPQFEMSFQQPSKVPTSAATADGTITAAATQSDLASASLDLISLLEYADIPTSLSLGGGLGSIDIGDIAPTFHVDQKMNYEFKPDMSMAIQLDVPMPFRVIDPVAGQVSTGNSATIGFKPNQTVMLSFPPALKTPVNVTHSYSMTGTLGTQTSQQYRLSVALRALILKGFGIDFTALSTDIDLSGSILPEHQLEHYTLDLPAFTPVTLPGLTLDPEDPRIDITEHSVRDTLNIGGGQRAVIYRTSIANSGDVDLRNAALREDLAHIFGTASNVEAVCMASSDLPLNGAFDGKANTAMLAPGTTLTPGQQGTVDLLLRVTPEIARVNSGGCFSPVIYTSSSGAAGVSPIGTPVHNNLDQCTGAVTGPDLLAPASFGASSIASIADYAIYGVQSVVLDGASGVSFGNVGSGGDLTVRKSGAAAPLQLVGDLHAGGDLRVDQSKVTADYIQVGDQVRVDQKSTLHTTGAISEGSACESPFDLPSIVYQRPSSSAPRVDVPAGGDVPLAPGDYRSLQLRAGSKVTLRAGVYNIDDLAISGDAATVAFDVSGGTVTVNLGLWHTGNTRGLRFAVPAGQSRAVRINYVGSAEVMLKNAVIEGTLVAPDAILRLDEGTQIRGAARAKSIWIGTAVTFVDHHHLDALRIAAACVTALQAPPGPVVIVR